MPILIGDGAEISVPQDGIKNPLDIFQRIFSVQKRLELCNIGGELLRSGTLEHIPVAKAP